MHIFGPPQVALVRVHALFLCLTAPPIPSPFPRQRNNPPYPIKIEIDIEETDTVKRIKERVEEQQGIPPIQQRLIFHGKQMADDKTAVELKLVAGSVLHLVLALRGGL